MDRLLTSGFFDMNTSKNRKWVSERRFTDLVALCHFLPGPTSSQLGIAVGITRGGILGGILAWIGFTAPSVAILIAFGFGVTEFDDVLDESVLSGLKIAAVAVVAQALWGMSTSLAPDKTRATIAILSGIAILLSPLPFTIVAVIILAGAFGWYQLRHHVDETQRDDAKYAIPKTVGIACAFLFFALLISLPLVRLIADNEILAIFDSFFRSGSLVFGGGHVVLPTLEAEVVRDGWVTTEQFIAGYGASQAIPGPLFTFSAYLGTVMESGPGGIPGGLIALVAIFLPSFLLVITILPFWNQLNQAHRFRATLVGINAAVVGILAAALFDPVWTSSIKETSDFALAIAAFGLLVFWKLPPWLVVVLCATAAFGISYL